MRYNKYENDDRYMLVDTWTVGNGESAKKVRIYLDTNALTYLAQQAAANKTGMSVSGPLIAKVFR